MARDARELALDEVAILLSSPVHEHRLTALVILAERFLSDPHHLMRKATGRMLREVGKRDEAALVAWLERHRQAMPRTMPRTMLRYAIERMSPERRGSLMARA